MFFVGFGLGVGCSVVFFWLVQWSATRLYMQAKGARGQAVKQEKDSELLAMMQDAAARFAAAKEAGEDLKKAAPKILIEVGMAHPMGALRFGGELKKMFEKLQDGGGLGGLIG